MCKTVKQVFEVAVSFWFIFFLQHTSLKPEMLFFISLEWWESYLYHCFSFDILSSRLINWGTNKLFSKCHDFFVFFFAWNFFFFFFSKTECSHFDVILQKALLVFSGRRQSCGRMSFYMMASVLVWDILDSTVSIAYFLEG